MNKYGHFSEKGNEFIVTRYDTPLPWVNYLSNGDYCAIVSSTGGGFSFYKSHHANNILRREQRNLISDRPGRYVYIKDNDSGEIFSLNVMPVQNSFDKFEAVHGMGYTTVKTESHGIAGEITYFVPMGVDAEIARIKITNISGSKRNLSVYFYEELQLGNFEFNEHERAIASMFGQAKINDEKIFANYSIWSTSSRAGDNFKSDKVWPYTVMIGATKSPESIETSQERFIGVHRDVHNPVSVENGSLSNKDNFGMPSVAAFCWNLELSADECYENDVYTNIFEKTPAKFTTEIIDELYTKTTEFWTNYVDGIKIKTPDEEINRNFNYWNKYQIYMNFNFGRAPSYYHLEQSMGMRDSFQDAFGMIPLSSKWAREQILRVASFIFSDGSPCDVTSRIEYKANKGIKVDVPLWMALATCNYINETADMAILDEVIPYLDGGQGTLYEHILLGLKRIACDKGCHGLPLFGGGDWNDSLNRVGDKGIGESVWLAQFIYYCINEIKPLLILKNDDKELTELTKIAEQFKTAHEEFAWDEDWYIIGYNDLMEAVGTKKDRVGNTYLNTQTWAVISGIGSKERLEKAMDAVDDYLETPYGLSLVMPAYDCLDENIGVSSAFARGMKENGAVFSHATAFNLVAKALLGRGNDMYRVYKKVLPACKKQDVHMCEPYIYSQFSHGPNSPEYGRGAYHWMTGTAAWMFRAVLDYMLGIKTSLEGLIIDPCINQEWDGFEVIRPFRKNVYKVIVSNPEHKQTGVSVLEVDGVKQDGNFVKYIPDGKEHIIKVIM
ncbi:MAG: hypothetical protein E7540_01885 [Ruminococcaceae bacterium]|nr:hypothetical protein [Oscillospiraceae bacterium]